MQRIFSVLFVFHSIYCSAAILKYQIGTNGSEIKTAKRLSDGRIVAVGTAKGAASMYEIDGVVSLFNANGSLDISFGGEGFVKFSPVGILDTRATDVLVSESGSIYVTGMTDSRSPSGERVFVSKFLPNGQLDTAFGWMGHKVFYDYPGYTIDSVGGIYEWGDGSYVLIFQDSQRRLAFLFFDPITGALDLNHGNGTGIFFDSTDTVIYEVFKNSTLQSGSIYVATDTAIRKYTVSIDPVKDLSFGVQGVVSIADISSTTVLLDGRLIFTYYRGSNGALKLSRHLPDGSFDSGLPGLASVFELVMNPISNNSVGLNSSNYDSMTGTLYVAGHCNKGASSWDSNVSCGAEINPIDWTVRKKYWIDASSMRDEGSSTILAAPNPVLLGKSMENLNGNFHSLIITDPESYPLWSLFPVVNVSLTVDPIRWAELTWSDTNNNEDGYKIFRRVNISDYVEIGTLPANSTSFRDTTPVPYSMNYYSVQPYKLTGELSGTSNYIYWHFGGVVPPEPSNLVVSPVSSSSLYLSWRDNSTNEYGFKIERSLSGAGPFSEIGTTLSNQNYFQDSALIPLTQYYYRVYAYNGSGNSDYTQVMSSTTLEPSPNAPSNLLVTAVGQTTIGLSWNDNSTNETSFTLERSTGAGFTTVATLAANTRTHTDSGLLRRTSYIYRVRANGIGGASGYSNSVTQKTK